MIIVRTPFRISFVGGTTDLPSFYLRHGGAVVSAAINKYMYIIVNKSFNDQIRVSYSKTETVGSVDEIQHLRVRECLKMLGISKGIEIVSVADVPAGTGLGSSSAFTVGLLHALHHYKGEEVSKQELAEQACYIELEALKEPIGKQDQFASAFGGLNYIGFRESGEVQVCPIRLGEGRTSRLEQCLMMFYTGEARSAADVLGAVQDTGSRLDEYLCGQRDLAVELRRSIIRDMDSVGRFMHIGWMLKRQIQGGGFFGEEYSKARQAGAIGGKVCGAGSRGFLLLYCHTEGQDAVRKVLAGYQEMKVGIDREGSKVVYEC